jgi:hypothetical protein
MTIATIITYLSGPTTWLLKVFLVSGWSFVKFIFWLTSPARLLAAIVGAVLSLFGGSADAGWLGWGPDPKTEAANQALQRAAHIAADAAAHYLQARDHHFRDVVQGGADSGALEAQNPAQQPSARARNVSRESAQAARGQPLVRDPANPHDPLREKGMGDEGLEPPTPSV